MNDETLIQFDTENETLSESEILCNTQFTVYESDYEVNSFFDRIRRFSVNHNHEMLIQCEDYLCFFDANGEYLYSLYQDDFTDTRAYFQYHDNHTIEMIYPYDNLYLRINANGECLSIVQLKNTPENLQKKLDFVESGNNSDKVIDGYCYHLEDFGTKVIKIEESTGSAEIVFQIGDANINREFFGFCLLVLTIYCFCC